MADVFDRVVGQPQVRDFLRTSVASGRVSQAYLFCGPAGSGKSQAAFALAKALLCAKGGDDTCDVCHRIERRKHPDVHFYQPESANGQYLVEQVRDVVSDVTLAPIQANKKIYILSRIDRMSDSAANAFLKTLEEPPEDAVLILLASSRESVLPTIVSRCQVVPFRTIPANEAAKMVAQNTGVELEVTRMALEACDGSIECAVTFSRSNERMEFRRNVLAAVCSLRNADSWDIIQSARDLVVQVKAPLDTVRAQQEAELAENADFLAKSAIRQIEARNKRALSAETRESLRQLTSIAGSFLRDVLITCAGTPDLIINVDVRDQIEDAAAHTDEARLTRAFAAIERCNSALDYNVSSETCIDALFFEMKEALYGSHSAC